MRFNRRGDVENTIVFYTADHGDMGGAHRLPFKGPFMYDELLNVPLTISYPLMVQKPMVSDSLVSLVDVVPTICSLTGTAWPDRLSGVDLSLLLSSPETEVRKRIFSEYYGKQKWREPIRTVREKNWKYNRYINDGEELYDLENDPGEIHNLAGNPQYADKQNELASHLLHWRQSTYDPLL